jgi:hypothetical protein
MTRTSKRQYLLKVKNRYLSGDKRLKNRILDEFCAVCGYSRKYAIRLLNGRLTRVVKKRGRRSQYNCPDFKLALERIWRSSDKLCSKSLKSAMPEFLEHYSKHYGELEVTVRDKLLRVSPATIDRILKGTRAKYGRGRSGTRPGTILREEIPIRTDFFDVSVPGYVEADTVAHCGQSLSGSFVWSLTVTDINTTWTEVRGVWNKGATGIIEAIREIELILPFALLGFDSDNGSEFLNHHLVNYFLGKHVNFTRSRPYKKNDNAHVEQKNWTHARRLLGINRIDNFNILPHINELYANEWSLFNNHFRPTLKLVKKIRVNSRYIKIYDEPKTPYKRVLESNFVKDGIKEKLMQIHSMLDPFQLKNSIDKKVKFILNRRSHGDY